MEKTYDFIIIGGGPSGSTAATKLAQKGFDVLVLEKEKFPRFHIGETLIPFCYSIFEELGVLEDLKSNFSRKPGVTFMNIDETKKTHWCFEKVIDDDSYLSFHVERAEFDEILLNNSSKNGATVLQEHKVTKVNLEYTEDLVEVTTIFDKDVLKKWYGKFLIDASGQDSFLGKKLGTKIKNPDLSNRIAFSAHWTGLSLNKDLKKGNLQIVTLDEEVNGWMWIIPIKKDKVSIGIVTDTNYVKTKDKPSNEDWKTKFYMEEVLKSTLCKEILIDAKLANQVNINSDYSYNVTKKFSNKYALIGDASSFFDPIFATGIFIALKTACLVSSALLINQDKKNLYFELEKVYKQIEGAYELINKVVTTFYDKNAFKFSDINNYSLEEHHQNINAIIHLILAGDFFTNYEEYIGAIDVLSNEENLKRFLNFNNHTKEDIKNTCIH